MVKQYAPDSEVALDDELIDQLALERDLYYDELEKCEREFDIQSDNQYYILSTKFISEWQKLVSSSMSNPGPQAGPTKVRTPSLMNEQLIEEKLADFDECIIKKQAQEGKDYKFVNRSVIQIFEMYMGTRIPRLAYFSGVNKLVEVYPIKFSFIFFSQSWLDLIKKEPGTKIPILTSLAYKNEMVLDLLYRLIEFSKKDDRNRSNLYLLNASARIYAGKQFDPVAYGEKIAKEEPGALLLAPGDEIKKNMMIGDLNIPPSNKPIMIVELMEEKWVYDTPTSASGSKEDRCQFCRKMAVLNYPCKCKQVEYCSEVCRQKDWRYHIKNCSVQQQENNKQPTFEFTEKSRRGLVGLQNLGNTCYMNAALQCLDHTQELTQYFYKKLYLDEINQKNPIGSKGVLVKSYAKFIETVLVTENQSVAPSRLKHTVGKIKDLFSGYEQHDSQEFLLFLLDTMHEDLNRVKNKPYTDGVDSQGRPDEIVAKQSWVNYTKRNQSYINDIMGGQYKSEVKCPDCNNISVTFDPFLTFTVPIPTNEAKNINIYYFFSNYDRETLKMTLTSKNNVVRELREDVASKTKTELSEIKFFILGFNGPTREVQDNETVDRLINEKQFNENGEERQLFAIQFSPEQLSDIENKKYLIFKFLLSYKVLTFKRPFLLNCSHLKGTQLYDRICLFLLKLWSKSEKQLEGKQKEAKFSVFRQKVKEEKIFKIFMAYGDPKEVKNKLIFANRVEIEDETDVTKLLLQNKYEVEFEVQFAADPNYYFNSYKTQTSDEPYDYSGQKTGTNESYTLEECLQEMKKPEKLLEGNEVFCSHCQDLKLAEKKMQMYKASKYIILQLRRFKQVGYQKSKNYAEVVFPLQLNLEGHLISPTLPQTYFINSQQDIIKPSYWSGFNMDKSTKFNLYGVVNHHGSLGGGHYTAYAKQDEKWYLFDDSRVEEVKPDSIVTKAAYLLFYERQ